MIICSRFGRHMRAVWNFQLFFCIVSFILNYLSFSAVLRFPYEGVRGQQSMLMPLQQGPLSILPQSLHDKQGFLQILNFCAYLLLLLEKNLREIGNFCSVYDMKVFSNFHLALSSWLIKLFCWILFTGIQQHKYHAS